jgi:hypothetical protein
MGLGMLRFCAALALCPLALLGAVKSSSSAIDSASGVSAFSMTSGQDMSMTVDYDSQVPMELDRIDIVAPGKSAGTQVSVKRVRTYGLPYVATNDYRPFGAGKWEMTPGSWKERAGAGLWHGKISYDNPPTNYGWYVSGVTTNYPDDDVAVWTNLLAGASMLSTFEPVSDTSDPVIRGPQLTRYGGYRVCYDSAANALSFNLSVPTNMWLRLGEATEPVVQLGSGYDLWIGYCKDWKDGPFLWETVTNVLEEGTAYAFTNYVRTGRAFRGSTRLNVVSNRVGCLVSGGGRSVTPGWNRTMADLLSQPLGDALANLTEDPFPRGCNRRFWPQPLKVPRSTNETVDVFWYVPPRDAAYVAGWSSTNVVAEDVVATLSLTNGIAVAPLPAPVVLLPGDRLVLSGGVYSNEAFRATFTGRR